MRYLCTYTLFQNIKAMKALRFITIALLMAVSTMVSSTTAQTIRDAAHHNIGRISPNGTVRNTESQPIGFFDRDGVIRNKHNKQIGLIKGLQIYNTDNERIGYILTDGTVRDGESRVLGNIDKSGKIYDPNKRIIGYAQGVRYEWIACYFFFHFFD